jgi:hypothetical protein
MHRLISKCKHEWEFFLALKKAIALSWWLVFLCISTATFSEESQLNIIVHSSVSASQLSASQLRRIFSRRQIWWQDQQPIVVYVLVNQHPSHLKFCNTVLAMFPYQLERIWDKLTYSGQGVRPIVVETEEKMLAAVQSHPGAIGYMQNPPPDTRVKTLRIIKE